MKAPLKFPPLLEVYITAEMLIGNAYADKEFYTIDISNHNNIIPSGLLHVYPHKILLTFTPKYAPYAWKVFSKYNMSPQRNWNKDLQLYIMETEENLYDILININNLLHIIKEKYDKANADVEQTHRK